MDYSTKMEDLLHQTEYQLDMQFYNIHFCIFLNMAQKRCIKRYTPILFQLYLSNLIQNILPLRWQFRF